MSWKSIVNVFCMCVFVARGRERNSFRQEGKSSSCYFILNGRINFHQLNIWVFIKHVIYPRHCARNMKYHSEQFLQGVNKLCVRTKLRQLDLTLCDPVDCSPPSSSIRENFQARKLAWVTISSSRGSSQPRDWTHISWVCCIGRYILYHWAAREAPFWVQFFLILSKYFNL